MLLIDYLPDSKLLREDGILVLVFDIAVEAYHTLHICPLDTFPNHFTFHQLDSEVRFLMP